MAFYGREDELQRLRDAFERTATDRQPQVLAVVGETGVGKTRLVQELYRQLSRPDAWDPSQYWPEDFGGSGTSLPVTRAGGAAPQRAGRHAAAAQTVTRRAKLSMRDSVRVWCATICAAVRMPLSAVAWASPTSVTP